MPVTINGSAGVTTNSGAVYNGIQAGTAVSASSTAVEFTNIPSWVRRVTVMLSGISTNGSSQYLLQLGSGSFSTSGYSTQVGNRASESNPTAGFQLVTSTGAAQTISGVYAFCLLGSNTWALSYVTGFPSGGQAVAFGSGSIALGGALDRVRLTTLNGTDAFDAGSINILYE